MRLLIASTNYRLAADLAADYSSVEVAGVVASYTDLLAAVRATPADRPVDVVLLDGSLESLADRDARLDLPAAVAAVREARAGIRAVALLRDDAVLDGLRQSGAEVFVEFDTKRAAANLATYLGLAVKAETAKVIAVVGLQGGAGRTFVAERLADALATDPDVPKRRDGRGGVLLVELDLQHATLAFEDAFPTAAYDHGRRTLARLLADAAPLGDDAITAVSGAILAADDTRRGYDLLLAPHGFREVDTLYRTWPDLGELRDRVRAVLAVLARSYSVIVLDTGNDLFLDPLPALAIAEATAVCAVVAPSTSGRSAVLGLRALLGDLLAVHRSRLVINRVTPANRELAGEIRDRLAGPLPVADIVPEPAGDARIWKSLASTLRRIED